MRGALLLKALVVVTLVSERLQFVFAEEAGREPASPMVISIAPLDGNKAQVPCWSPAVGQAVTEMLVESLEKAGGKFQVLASPEPDAKAVKNQPGEPDSRGAGGKPGGTGGGRSRKSAADVPDDSLKPDSARSDSAAPVVADFMLYGNVTEFGSQTNSSKIGDFVSSSPFGSLGAKMVTARVIIDWRLVDAETKMVVTRGTAMGTAHGSEFDTAGLAPAKESNPADGINPAKGVDPMNPAAKPNPAANMKTAASTKSGSGNLAFANNIMGGLNKALNGSSGEGNNGDHYGTTANRGAAANKSSKGSSQPVGDNAAGGGEVIGYDNSLFMASALGKAAAQAVNSASEQLAVFNLPESARRTKAEAANEALKHTPGKVLAVAGKDAIIISLGSNQSFKDGDHLNLYQPVDIKDEKGNVVFTDEKLVGELTLESVQADRSRASCAGDLTVQQGWVVKAK